MVDEVMELEGMPEEIRDTLVAAVQQEASDTLDFIERGLLVLGTQIVIKTEENVRLRRLLSFAGELIEEMFGSAPGCEIDPMKIEAFRVSLAEVA